MNHDDSVAQLVIEDILDGKSFKLDPLNVNKQPTMPVHMKAAENMVEKNEFK